MTRVLLAGRGTGPAPTGRTTKTVHRLLAALTIAMLAFTGVPSAHAQAPGADQRQAAANAFDRGTSAYLSEDFAAAARWFEMANNLAPAAPALLQAIRAHRRAGNPLRALNLSVRLRADFADIEAAVTEANTIIDELGPQYAHFEVECDAECTLELEGAVVRRTFFAEPGESHQLRATFETGERAQRVEGTAGTSTPVQFTAPDAPIVVPDNPIDLTTPVEEDEGSGGISKGFFITSLVLTAGAGAALVWSGLDTLDARDEYEMVAAQERATGAGYPRSSVLLSEGQDKETRTNILIGVTAGLGALTILTAALTDWSSSDDDEEEGATIRPVAGASAEGGMVGLQGSF